MKKALVSMTRRAVLFSVKLVFSNTEMPYPVRNILRKLEFGWKTVVSPINKHYNIATVMTTSL
jgi:hypothetical protein